MKQLPWIVVAAAALIVAAGLRAPSQKGPDAEGFGVLPVLHNGRVKPADTVARSSLMMLRGKQSVRDGERTLRPSEWLLDVLTQPEVADKYKVFMINDADILAMIGKRPEDGRFYSFMDLALQMEEIRRQAMQASELQAAQRDRFQSAILSLEERLGVYQRLKNTLQVEDTQDFPEELAAFAAALGPGAQAIQAHMAGQKKFDQKALDRLGMFFQRYQFLKSASAFHPIPPPKGGTDDEWGTVGGTLLDSLKTGQPHQAIANFALISRAWKAGDRKSFDAALADQRDLVEARIPHSVNKARWEVLFNRVQPFYLGIVFYTLVTLMYFFSWLWWEGPLQRAAWALLIFTFVLHSIGMFTRMWLEGRPPVTNLYSSAVFIGWFSVLLAIPFERWSKRGFAALGGSTIGAATLIIAHNLTGNGDTMEMMRAVLDSNFWLATHVVTITIGYSATYLAGILAHLYILRGALTKSLGTEDAKALSKSTYGVICFALFFSFIGTVLGGIWADQSWGRFWGWDPKENGALLIVLWNALILHARWGGYARERGIMMMAVVGNIITSLSWFGVNMLGIGLHSYGFMDKAFWALTAFTVSQLIVIAIAAIPPEKWRSRVAKLV